MIEIYVLSGFLGAGKTSVLQHIIASAPKGDDMVLIVNEFGKLGLDGKLVQGKGYNTVELLSGCICCTLNDDLQDSLAAIAAEFHPAKIVIEASGIANPYNIRRAAASAKLRGELSVKCVATVIDMRMWRRRQALGKIYHEQLTEADLIILNKADLVADAAQQACEAEVKAAYPSAGTVKAAHGCFPLELLWNGGAAPRGLQLSRFAEHAATPEYVSVSYSSDKPFEREKLLDYLRALPESVLRIKGQASFANGEKQLVDRVGDQLTLRAGLDNIEDTRLVFIGENIDSELLQRELGSL